MPGSAFGCLFVEGWGCVPTVFVLCSWASQPSWVRTDFFSKWQPAVLLMVMSILWGLCLHKSCPHHEPQLPPLSQETNPRPAGRFDPDPNGVPALAWDPAHVKLCMHPPRIWSLCLPVLWNLLHTSWPSVPNTLGATSPIARFPGWEPEVEFVPLTPKGESLRYSYFQSVGHPPGTY